MINSSFRCPVSWRFRNLMIFMEHVYLGCSAGEVFVSTVDYDVGEFFAERESELRADAFTPWHRGRAAAKPWFGIVEGTFAFDASIGKDGLVIDRETARRLMGVDRRQKSIVLVAQGVYCSHWLPAMERWKWFCWSRGMAPRANNFEPEPYSLPCPMPDWPQGEFFPHHLWDCA